MHLGCAASDLTVRRGWATTWSVKTGSKPSSSAYCRGSQSRVPRFFTLMFVDHGGSAGREAVGRTRYCESCRRLQAGRGIPARQRLRCDLGCRASRVAGATARNPAGVEGLEARMVADVAENMAVDDLRENQRTICDRARNPSLATGVTGHLRDRRGPGR